MLKQCSKHMLQALLQAHAPSNALSTSTYGRTDVLTKNYSPLDHVLTFVNAREKSQKFIEGGSE